MSDFAQVDHIFNRKLNHISCYLFTAYERWGKAFVLMALKRSRLVIYQADTNKMDLLRDPEGVNKATLIWLMRLFF